MAGMKIKLELTPNFFQELEKEVVQAASPQVNSIKKKAVEELRKATPVDTGNARDSWSINSEGDINNSADYIDRLNYGSSSQAPSHFVEKTLLSIEHVKPNGMIVLYGEDTPP